MISSRVKVFIVLLILGLSSLSLIYWSFLNYQNINTSINKIATPNDKSNKINRVFQEIIEADNLFHSYTLTGDSLMLKSYQKKMNFVNNQIESLESDFLNDRVQQNNLDSLSKIVRQKSEYLTTLLKLKNERSNAFFTREALMRIGRQLKDTAFIEKALLRSERLVAVRDSIEKEELVKKPDEYKGIEGFFRKIFGRPSIRIDTIRSIEEQINYSLETSIDTSIIRDYFVDTTLIAVRKILLDVLTEEIDLQYKLNEAELQLYEQDQRLIDNIKIIVSEILEEEKTRNKVSTANVLEETNQATQEIFMIGGIGILLSAIFLFLIFKDITKANNLRKHLQIEKERALNLAQAKEEFLAKMSHEIRTPLHNIMGFTQLLAKGDFKKDEKEYIDTIFQSNRYLSELIDNILEKSKIDAGIFKVEKTAVFLQNLANELHLLFKYSFLEKSLQFEIEIEDKLKQNPVWVDNLKLKQVLINLIGNALKFTESGFVKIAFSLKGNKGKYELHILVEDSGKGLEDYEKERIFNQFEQGEHAKLSSLTGSGLGLTISRDIIEAFGGEIKVESTHETGTRFHLFFPIHIDEGDSNILTKQEVLNFEIIDSQFNVNLLVIEDDPWNAKLMINILKDRVRQLKVCINAEEAITYLKTAGSDVDLIMTDISLPKMDGIQFFKLIRKLGYNMPVVAITAHVLKNKKTEMLSKGFSDIIIKPFQVNDITRVLRQHFIANEVPNTGIAHSGKKYEALWVFAGKDELSYQKLVADFKSSLQTKYQDFEIAIKERNAQKVSTLAHQMKSAFEQININSFSEGFQSIVLYGELDKRDRLFEEAKDILQQLGKVIDNI